MSCYTFFCQHFKYISMKEQIIFNQMLIKIWIPGSSIGNWSVFVQVMNKSWIVGTKPLPKPMMTQFLDQPFPKPMM